MARRPLACLAAMCAMLAAPAAPAHAAVQRPAILVLFVDDSSQSWVRDMSDGIGRVAFRSGASAPILYYEYLDTVRFSDPDRRARIRATLQQKYQERPIDLVVAVAPNAIAFVDESRDALWPKVPVLFTSYTAAVPARVLAHPASAGLAFEWGFDQAVATMKRVFPDTTRVAVVTGSSAIEQVRQQRDLDEIRRAGLEAVEVAGQSTARTLSAVSAQPGHTLVFIAGGQVDDDGSVIPTWPLCQIVTTAANRPTFMMGAQFLGCGVVGGLMRDFTKIGAVMGARALDMLTNPRPRSETIPFASFSTLAFDARQLERWHVDESRLPPGAAIQFQPFSIWRAYRWEIVLALGGLVVQTLLIGGLLYERRERVKAENDSRRNLAVAAHADRRAAMTALTGSIAHELNQPLGSILHNASAAERLIASERATPQELLEILRDIRREDARATQIIQRQRTLLRTHEVDKRPLDLFAVVRDSLDLVQHDAESKSIRIEAALPATSCVVVGDQVLLQQVILNLIMNAMDAMRETPRAARRIVVGSALVDESVEISVRDWGHGLPDEAEYKLFEPFVTTKPNGLGIGLSIVRSILDAHGGTIDARNVADGGAIFRVVLPRVDAAAEKRA